jgi:hypothetical protein
MRKWRKEESRMGVVKNVGADTFPKQGRNLGRNVRVCFNYDTSRWFNAVCVRDDVEEPGVEIFRLDDGRHVLSTECQWQPTY